jgi:hypothetical protein
MDLFIYLPAGTDIALDELEEALGEAVGEGGRVTGSGSGATGSNVDLRVDDRLSREKVLAVVRSTLTLLGVRRARIVLAGVECRFP